MKFLFAAALTVPLALTALPSLGAIATTASGNATLTFNEHPKPDYTLGPVSLTASNGDQVIFTAVHPYNAAGFSKPDYPYGLGTNGLWNNQAGSYAWVNDGTDVSMRFTFATGPVSFVGGVMNYPQTGPHWGLHLGPVDIRAIGLDGQILEQYFLKDVADIQTPEALNEGAFRGIVRDTADIYAFEIGGGAVIRNLTFVTSVPEPGSALLLCFGLAGLAAIKRKALVVGLKAN